MKKGFTLIELLAVIVILAIIALIATPIILGIITDARNEAKVRSAELYLTALEQAIIRKKMSDTTFNPSSCEISGATVTCGGETLNVDVDGEKPTSGTITINNGQTEEVKLSYTDLEFETDENNNLVSYERAYEIGEEVTFNPGDQDRTFYVLGETKDTVTLLMSNVLGEPTVWYHRGTNEYGPIDLLLYLNSLTNSWNNVDPIVSYEYVNNPGGTIEGKGYQKLQIKNGETIITALDGNNKDIYATRSEEIEYCTNYEEASPCGDYIPTSYEKVPTRARLITKEEIDTILEQSTNTNFISGHYWTLSGVEGSHNWSAYLMEDDVVVWDVESIGYDEEGNYVRPVITIPKTKLSE